MPGADVRAAKAALRAQMLARRQALEPDLHATLSETICRRGTGLPAYREASTVHTYLGRVAGEVDTRVLLEAGLKVGKRVVCPRVGPDRQLESREIRSLEDFVPGPRGLLEPDPKRCPRVAVEEIDVVFVPGIAFDRAGRRIGFGAGYYDRFLSLAPAPSAGLAFSLQVLEEIPQGPRDIPVDWIVTDLEIIDCRSFGTVRPPDRSAQGDPPAGRAS